MAQERDSARPCLLLPTRVREIKHWSRTRSRHVDDSTKEKGINLEPIPRFLARGYLGCLSNHPQFSIKEGKNLGDAWRGWARYRREFEFSRFVWPPRGNQVFPLCMAVPFNEPLLVTLLYLTSSSLFFFSLFSSSPSPENYTVLGLAKFLATIRPYPFNTPLLSLRRRNETSVEKERKFYPRREHL